MYLYQNSDVYSATLWKPDFVLPSPGFKLMQMRNWDNIAYTVPSDLDLSMATSTGLKNQFSVTKCFSL